MDGDVLRHPRFRLGAVIAVALAVGLVAWLVLRDDGGSSATRTDTSDAAAMTPSALLGLARSVRHPIFWLGRRNGTTYEVTRTTNGKIYVRYLPAGAQVGTKTPYLTVATYPFPAAYAAIRRQATVKGAVTARIAGGGLALLDSRHPESVHVAYPHLDYQVEVYDPTPARAMQLVSTGRVKRLAAAGGPSTAAGAITTRPTAVTPTDLAALALRLGHPIYWAGPKPGYRYELSTTSNGRVFIRYVPPGGRIGDPQASYLTVATYPYRGALAAVAKSAGAAEPVRIPGGGIGVVDAKYPQSVHLAYPGSDLQLEVFDPSPSAARKLVASGAVVPVP